MKIKTLFLAAVLPLVAGSCNTDVQKETADNKEAVDIVTETINTRRSIRRYKPQSISRDTMQIILNAGIHAPNGKGIQSWQVRIVDNREFLDKISLADDKRTENPENQKVQDMFFDAPVVAFIAYDTGYDLSQVDCGMLGENMILTAWSMGIGSCCLGGAARFLNTNPGAAEYLEKLDFPETHKLLYCIAFGYPDESPDAKPRDHKDRVRFIE